MGARFSAKRRSIPVPNVRAFEHLAAQKVRARIS